MEKASNVGKMRDVLVKSIRWLKAWFETVEAFLNKVSQLSLRSTGIIICVGGVCAMAGWLLATFRPDPLGPTWSLGVWFVIIGTFALLVGILMLSAHYMLRIGIIGQYSIIIFLLGALILIAGAFAVDLFILPWIAKLLAQLHKVPVLNVDDLISKVGLPSQGTLTALGLVFLSGAPLAPGCLLVGLVFLLAGVRPSSSLLLLIAAALLNLGGQFLLHIAFLGPLLGVLFYLALAWFGFTLWSPWKFSLLEKLLPVEEVVESVKSVESETQ